MAFAHGKAILLGEHAVVYGRTAIAVALERGVRASARTSHRDLLSVDSEEESSIPEDSDSDDRLARAFASLLALYPESRAPAAVDIQVSLPGGAGLGCSAAMGVAVTAALDAHYGVSRTPEERAEASMPWERVFHGNPSGIDSAVSALGGMLLYRKGERPVAITPREPFSIVVAHTGISSSTKEMVESVARQHRQNRDRVEQVLDGIASLVMNGRLAAEAGDLVALGQLMNLNHALLASLMLSTVEIEELVRVARDGGALGAKLTGAGGGGSILALARDEDHAESLVASLKERARFAFTTKAGSEELPSLPRHA